MSRSYHKYIRVGTCTGSNTEYYRTKHRKIRRAHKNEMRTQLRPWINSVIGTHFPHNSKGIPDQFYDENMLTMADEFNISPHIFKDSWDEPTDGSHLVTPDLVNFVKIDYANVVRSGHHSKRKWNRDCWEKIMYDYYTHLEHNLKSYHQKRDFK